jgi:2-phosphosulfolactate phosphatase
MVSLRHEGGKMGRARISTALLPGASSVEADACVVVDVLRATSTLVTMFERGLEEALIAPSIDAARTVAGSQPGLLLCGEEGGLPPDGFDHGNSPVEFLKSDLRGQRTVFATTNGTRALNVAQASTAVLVGALLNASAVSESAVQAGGSIFIVCAGENGGMSVSLEDVFCAGAIVDRIASHARVDLDDSSAVAWRVYRSFGGSASEALLAAEHGRALQSLGLGEDVSLCAQIDRFASVPRAVRGHDGMLRVSCDQAARAAGGDTNLEGPHVRRAR